MKKRLLTFLLSIVLITSAALSGCAVPATADPSAPKATGEAAAPSPAENDFLTQNVTGKGIKADGTPVKVGITVSRLDSEMISTAVKTLEFLIKEAGGEVTSTQANDDVNTQMSQFNDFIQSGCDVIVTQPADSQALAPAVAQANEAGVAVIAINRSVYGDNMTVDLFVGSDDTIMAELCAEDLIKQADGKEVKIGTLQGVLATANASLRAEGFANYIKDYPNIINVGDRPCDWKNELAEPAAIDMLTVNPDLFAIFSHSDCMLQGIFSAFTQADRMVKRGEEGHIVLYGVDGDAYALEKIREGYLDATVEQSPLMMATVAAKAILTKVVNGEALTGEEILVPPTFINHENVDDPNLWGNFDVDAGELWPMTEEVWNSYIR